MLPDHLSLLLGQKLSCDRIHQVEGDSEGAEYAPYAQGQPAEWAWSQPTIQLPEKQQTHTNPGQSTGHVSDIGDRGSCLQLMHCQFSWIEGIPQIAENCKG